MEENKTNAGNDGKGISTAGLVVGIIALVLSFIPCLGMWAMLPAIVGIVLSAIGMNQAGKAGAQKGMALGGLICSIIAAAIAAYWIYAVTMAVKEAPAALEELSKELKESGAIDSLNKAIEQLKNLTDSTYSE